MASFNSQSNWLLRHHSASSVELQREILHDLGRLLLVLNICGLVCHDQLTVGKTYCGGYIELCTCSLENYLTILRNIYYVNKNHWLYSESSHITCMFFEGARLLLRWLIKVVKCLVRITASLPLIVVVECLRINQQRYNDVAETTFDKILQCDAMRWGWFCHIPQLVFEIVDLVLGLNSLFKLGDDLAEEHIYHEGIYGTLMINIEHSPEVL